MQLILTPEEVGKVLWNSMCNGGINELTHSGLEMLVDDANYDSAKETLKAAKLNESICLEDVFLQILKDGKTIVFKDLEGDDDGILSLELATTNLMKPEAAKDILISLDENDGGDAWTAYNILQYAMYGKLVYG